MAKRRPQRAIDTPYTNQTAVVRSAGGGSTSVVSAPAHDHDTDYVALATYASHIADSDAHHDEAHVLSGANHTASGLSTGEVLAADTTTTFSWRTLLLSEITATGGDGIDITTNTISVDLASTSGLEFSSGELRIDLISSSGLVLSASGLSVDLRSTPGLELDANGLGVDLRPNPGLELDANGLGMGDPSTLTAATTNAVTSATHTHDVTHTSDGAANHSTLLSSSASGGLTLDSVTTPLVESPANLSLSPTGDVVLSVDLKVDQVIKPSSDTTTAVLFTKADGTTAVLTLDTSTPFLTVDADAQVTGDVEILDILDVDDIIATADLTITPGGDLVVSSDLEVNQIIKPPSDTTTAIAITAANGSTASMVFDTSTPHTIINTNTEIIGGYLDVDNITGSANLLLDPATDIRLDQGGNVEMRTTSAWLKTDNFASQTSGWGIHYNGSGDFRYLFADEMHVKSFIADLEQALAGGQIIGPGVTTLAEDYTLPTAGNASTVTLNDLPSASGMRVFTSGDIIAFRQFSRSSGELIVSWAWGVVTAYSDNADGTQDWTFTRSTTYPGIASGTISAEAIVLGFGTDGQGYYEVNSVDGIYGANSPYSQIVTWDTHPGSTAPGEGLTVRVRTGNLTGVGFSGQWGTYAAGADSTEYLVASGSGVRLHNIDLTINDGTYDVIELAKAGTVKFGTDVSGAAGTRFSFDASSGDTILGQSTSDNVTWDESASTLTVTGTIVVQAGSGIGNYTDAGALAELDDITSSYVTDAGALITADDLDDVSDGSTYGRVNKTIITSGYIQTGSGTKDATLDGWNVGVSEIVGQLNGVDQVVLNTSGQITADSGDIVLDGDGITIKDAGTAFVMLDSTNGIQFLSAEDYSTQRSVTWVNDDDEEIVELRAYSGSGYTTSVYTADALASGSSKSANIDVVSYSWASKSSQVLLRAFQNPSNQSSISVDVSAGGSETVTVTALDGIELYGNLDTDTILPHDNATKDLGSTGKRWQNVYSGGGDFSGNVEIDGYLKIDDYIAPPTNNTGTVGTDSYRFSTIYAYDGDFADDLVVDGNIFVGNRLLPDSDNGAFIGNDSLRFSSIFSKGSLRIFGSTTSTWAQGIEYYHDSVGAGDTRIGGIGLYGDASGNVTRLYMSTGANPWSAPDLSVESGGDAKIWNNLDVVGNIDVDGNIYPPTNNTGSVGTASYRFADVYTTDLSVSGDIVPLFSLNSDLGSATKQFDWLYVGDIDVSGSIYIDGSIRPPSDNTGSVGTNSYRFGTIYAYDGDFEDDVSVEGDLYVTGSIIGGVAEEVPFSYYLTAGFGQVAGQASFSATKTNGVVTTATCVVGNTSGSGWAAGEKIIEITNSSDWPATNVYFRGAQGRTAGGVFSDMSEREFSVSSTDGYIRAIVAISNTAGWVEIIMLPALVWAT
jgi:hypothetical protein